MHLMYIKDVDIQNLSASGIINILGSKVEVH